MNYQSTKTILPIMLVSHSYCTIIMCLKSRITLSSSLRETTSGVVDDHKCMMHECYYHTCNAGVQQEAPGSSSYASLVSGAHNGNHFCYELLSVYYLLQLHNTLNHNLYSSFKGRSMAEILTHAIGLESHCLLVYTCTSMSIVKVNVQQSNFMCTVHVHYKYMYIYIQYTCTVHVYTSTCTCTVHVQYTYTM